MSARCNIKGFWFLLVALLAVAGCQRPPDVDPSLIQTPDKAYDFQWVNPLVATVVRTPPIQRATLPAPLPTDQIRFRVFPDREIPRVLWFHPSYEASLVRQRGRAPLVFLIAGTGAGHDSPLNVTLQQIFFAAGFHVLSLSSPTHPNFIVTASTTSVPGLIKDDASDLYRAMQLAYERVEDRIEVSSFNLSGYSLGGWQAAYVAELDSREKVFNFQRTLMINPPVNLFDSLLRVDALLETNLKGGVDAVPSFLQEVFEALASVSKAPDFSDFNEDFLYRAYLAYEPPDEDLAALIGISFRLTSNDMVFTADVMSEFGYIVEPGTELTSSTPLTDYFRAGVRRSFKDYFEKFFIPFHQSRDPAITRESVIADSSLTSIEDFLISSPSVGVVTNEDDIILDHDDVEYLRRVFGDRATLFPTGGHCGNFDYPHFIAAVAQFMREGQSWE